MGLHLSNSFGARCSPILPDHATLDSISEQRDEVLLGDLREEDQKAHEVFEAQKISFSEIENPELFKSYRYHKLSLRGPVTDEEYQIFIDVFTMLSTLGTWGLFKKMGKIEALKERVAHIHPFNFLETLVINPALKRLFVQVKENNGFVWSRCKKNFKEEVEVQNQMGNIKPHLCNFAQYMQVHPLDLCLYLNENKVEDMMAALLKKHSS